ncbi:hypothetical protein SUGI_0430830 [Cryptomeria japonica]|uniref:uncharacterized protein LOC131047700 n=1 Tax=Cryptomeria japonica TaxID=3369 RepID=UPI002408E532|nr:uncharacterized protein LOC131047700 [Cryptomeria japonica]GLJ22858.1 hypothetical protein SUGI_0430830 [Cryptomeria japonica]
MGACFSSSSSAQQNPTAKLILEDGGLKEFPDPVTVEGVVAEKPGFFVCDADSMSFDDYLFPLPAEETLELDQIYFLFPVEKLKHRVPASDMAALAVKASAALKRTGRKRSRCKINPTREENLDLLHVRRVNHKIRAVNFRVDESEALKSRSGRRVQSISSMRRVLANKSLNRKLSTIEEGFSVK